jgi:hypothetical protein
MTGQQTFLLRQRRSVGHEAALGHCGSSLGSRESASEHLNSEAGLKFRSRPRFPPKPGKERSRSHGEHICPPPSTTIHPPKRPPMRRSLLRLAEHAAHGHAKGGVGSAPHVHPPKPWIYYSAVGLGASTTFFVLYMAKKEGAVLLVCPLPPSIALSIDHRGVLAGVWGWIADE